MSAPQNDLGPLLDALDQDGVIVAPCPVGYVAAASSAAGVERIFELGDARAVRHAVQQGGGWQRALRDQQPRGRRRVERVGREAAT